jgi:hypothetical protein
MSSQDRAHLSHGTIGESVAGPDLSTSPRELSELRLLRRRERLVSTMRKWWAPVASALTGVVLGGVAGYEMDGPVEDPHSVYPYGIATAALVPMRSISSARRSLMISIITMTFILGFLAGVAAGDSLNDVDQFSTSVRYGVAKEEGT